MRKKQIAFFVLWIFNASAMAQTPRASASKSDLAARLVSRDGNIKAGAQQERLKLDDSAKAKLARDLLQYLASKDINVYSAAHGELWALKPQSIAVLSSALKGESAPIRLGAVKVLEEIYDPAKERIHIFSGVVAGDSSPEVRAAAAEALASYYGPPPPDVMDVLTRALLKDRDSAVRKEAAHALFRAGPEAMAPLIAALKDPSGDVREEVAQALGSLRAQGRGAIPALQTALADGDRYVREEAAKALYMIDPSVKGAKFYTGVEDAFFYQGRQPPTAIVTYTAQDGKTYQSLGFIGWVTVMAKARTDVEVVRKSVEENGGKLINGLPRAGEYTAAVKPGREAPFIKAMFKYKFIENAFPEEPIGPASAAPASAPHSAGGSSLSGP